MNKFTSTNLKEIENELEQFFIQIGTMGYVCSEIKAFYQDLKQKMKINSLKEIQNWIETELPKLLKKPHPGKVYTLIAASKIFSLSTQFLNNIAPKILSILKEKVKKVATRQFFNEDLYLGCIKFLTDFYPRLTRKNRKETLKIFDEIKRSEPEFSILKKEILQSEEIVKKRWLKIL